VSDTLSPFFNDSVAFRDSDETWKSLRKTVSAAFYKEKTKKMMQINKEHIVKQIMKWQMEIDKTGKGVAEVDLREGVQDMFMRTIINIGFGEDRADELVPYIQNGKVVQKSIAQMFE